MDPEVEQGRPYACANAFEFGAIEVFVVNVLTGAVVDTYQSPEPQGCRPLRRSATCSTRRTRASCSAIRVAAGCSTTSATGDSGLRIVDVTDPAHPVEVGSFDYPGLPGDCCAHYAAPTSPTEAAFYLPNANKSDTCTQACFFQGRETWGAYFGSDGDIYASDFWLGFFIVNPS